MAKMGRPRKKDARRAVIGIALAPSEARELRRQAKIAGVSISAYVRRKLFGNRNTCPSTKA